MTFSKEKTSQAAKDYLMRLKDSLNGKNQVQLPDIELKKITPMVSDLLQIHPEDWWSYAFSREPLNRCFNDSQRQGMYLQAMDCGTQTARKLMEEYPGLTPTKLAEKLGLVVEYPQMPQSSHRVLFAEFAEQGVIRIFQDGIAKGKSLQKGLSQDCPFRLAAIEEILMAHELYHFVELQNPSLWSKSFKVTLWQVGWIKNTSPVFVLSEIAAMAFAQTLCQLEFSPYVLDAFLVYGYSPKAGSALYGEMMEAAKTACHMSSQTRLALAA